MNLYSRRIGLVVLIALIMNAYLIGQGIASALVPKPVPTVDPMSGMMMPGMNMTGDMAPISKEGVPPATDQIGGQPLAFRMDNGVKVFELTAKPVMWNLLENVTTVAWTYNGTVPGPMIRVTEGDKVRIILKNELPEETTIHWHGMQVPIGMDGVPGISQEPIKPGESFTYEFTVSTPGTYMYHSHVDDDKQIGLGLYAPFIIDPKVPTKPAPDVDISLMISEWRVMNGVTYAAMPMSGMEPNYFTLNGKASPATGQINIKLGQRVRIRYYAIGQMIHPMHLHGIPFKVVAIDGHDVPEASQLTMDTVSVAPGQRFDIEFTANALGQWMLHCHIPHHLTNDGLDSGHGGLTIMLNVTQDGTDSGAPSSTPSGDDGFDGSGS